MIVAIIQNEVVVSINEYPELSDIHELDEFFDDNYTLVDVTGETLPDYTMGVDTLFYTNGVFVVEHAEEGETAPTTEEDLMYMAVDHEYRLTLLELGVV